MGGFPYLDHFHHWCKCYNPSISQSFHGPLDVVMAYVFVLRLTLVEQLSDLLAAHGRLLGIHQVGHCPCFDGADRIG